MAEKIQDALATLPEKHRTILVLREVEGLSYEELAERLEIHKGTVMSRLFHARKKMQVALRDYAERAPAERRGVGAMKDCVRYAPMLGAREGELTQDEQRALDAHLEGCADCRATAAELAALDGLVGESLMARANSRDFAPFVDQVMARVALRPGGGREAARPRAPAAASSGGSSRTRAPRSRRSCRLLAVAALVVYVRSSSGGGSGEVAMFEMATEGEVTMVLQTKDGPVVLLDDGEHS